MQIESDTENYIKWRLCGGTLKLKQGTVPTKFECQKRKRTSTVTRTGFDKRQIIDFYEKLLTKEVRPSVAQQETEFVPCNNVLMREDAPTNPLPNDNTIKINLSKAKEKKTKNKSIQVEQLKKNVQTQTVMPRKNIKLLVENLDDNNYNNHGNDNSESSDSSSSLYSVSIEDYEVDINYCKSTLLKIEKNSKLYLGLPRQSYFIISLLEENIKCPLVNILITLKKLNLMTPIVD